MNVTIKQMRHSLCGYITGPYKIVTGCCLFSIITTVVFAQANITSFSYLK
jgi:hypothetical protein